MHKGLLLHRAVATLASERNAVRVLQVNSATSIGGGERHVADLANALAQRGHDVYAVLRHRSPLVGELRSLPQENITMLPLRNSLDIGSALRLAHLIREREIEVVHAHLARDYPLAALAVERAGTARLVITRHVLFPLNRLHRLTLRRVAYAIAVSRAVGESLRGIFAESKIAYVPNGIDLKRFAVIARSGARDRLLVGTVGHLAPIKGHEDFIRAASLIAAKRADVDFVIVGDDESPTKDTQTQLERLIRELGLSQRVHLAGRVDETSRLLSDLDLFVSASRSEGFGLAIIEAMASGVPVVATRSAGAREIIEDGETGRLVPIGDAHALAEAILCLLDDREGRERLRQRALETVRQRFSLERMIEETERVYRRALALSE